MTYKEAVKAFNHELGDRDEVIISGYDFNKANIFVFNARPKNKLGAQIFDHMYAVNKTTGKVTTFNPMDYDADDYLYAVKHRKLPI